VSFFFFSELTQIVTDVVADPTLPRTEDHECPKYVNLSFWLNLTHMLAEFSSTFFAGGRLASQTHKQKKNCLLDQ